MKITVLKGPNNLKLDACLLQWNVSEKSWSSAEYSFSWTSIYQAKAAINWNQPRIYFFCFSYETNIENDVYAHISTDMVKTIGTCNMLSICCCYSTENYGEENWQELLIVKIYMRSFFCWCLYTFFLDSSWFRKVLLMYFDQHFTI